MGVLMSLLKAQFEDLKHELKQQAEARDRELERLLKEGMQKQDRIADKMGTSIEQLKKDVEEQGRKTDTSIEQLKQQGGKMDTSIEQLKKDVEEQGRKTDTSIEQLKKDVEEQGRKTDTNIEQLKKDVEEQGRSLNALTKNVGEASGAVGTLGFTMGAVYEMVAREALASEHGHAVDGACFYNISDLAALVRSATPTHDGEQHLLEKRSAALAVYTELLEHVPAFLLKLVDSFSPCGDASAPQLVCKFDAAAKLLKDIALDDEGKLSSEDADMLMDTDTGLVLMSSLVFGGLTCEQLVALRDKHKVFPVVQSLEVDMRGTVEALQGEDGKLLELKVWLGEIKANLNKETANTAVQSLAVRAAFLGQVARMLLPDGCNVAVTVRCCLVGTGPALKPTTLGARGPFRALKNGNGVVVTFERMQVRGSRRKLVAPASA